MGAPFTFWKPPETLDEGKITQDYGLTNRTFESELWPMGWLVGRVGLSVSGGFGLRSGVQLLPVGPPGLQRGVL